MTKYVVGFLFDDLKQRVVLIKKQRGPANMAGKLNGVGGKIEVVNGVEETPEEAMAREFVEEAGPSLEWTKFMVLSGNDWVVHFFYCVDEQAMYKARTRTDERIGVYWVSELFSGVLPCMSNLRWILPMAQTHLSDHVALYHVMEAEVAA